MTWRVAALPFILLLPGYFTLHLPPWGEMSDLKRTLGQCLFLSLLISVLISGLLGLVLAQVGIFSLGGLLLALAAYSVFCLALIAAKRISDLRYFDWAQYKSSIADFLNRKPVVSPAEPSAIGNRKFTVSAGIRLGWEDAIIIILFCLSLLLYAKPAEYIIGWLDAGWYVNTGIHIAKTGSLTGESRIFSSLPPSAKPLFYSSFASLKGMFPYFPDVASRGIYLWAFAMADPARGEVTAYHPPLFSIWIAIFYALGGVRFCLYATPFFGALGVLSLYFAGKAMFGREVGLLAAALLAISFTQIYFSRVPYSEVLTQCLLFSGIYTLTTYTLERKPLYAAIAALSFGQAILSRFDSLIVVLPLVMFFGCWIALKRSPPKHLGFFAIPLGLLIIDGIVLALTASGPYVELNSYGLWFKLRSLLIESPALLAISVVSLGGLLVLIILLGLQTSEVLQGDFAQQIPHKSSDVIIAKSFSRPRRSNHNIERVLSRIYEARHLITTLLSLAILLLAIYAYFIYPSTARGTGPGKSGTLAQLGQFVSPLGLWLGVFGLVELIRRDANEKTTFFLALILIYGPMTLSILAINLTLSYVYPLRRQVPFVIPSLMLLASYAILIWNKGGILSLSKDGILSLSKGGKLLRIAQLVAIGILLASFLALDMPYMNYGEMRNTIAFSEKLADHFGEQDVVVFEETWFQDSRVGHFAAPLWSIYDKDALLISTANVDEKALSTAVAQWLDGGKKAYFISQSNPAPLFLKGYELVPIAEERWRSSTITDRLTFPPRIWEFEIPFYIYQIAEGESL
jgi:4-amino-4-deoxy-L-arabinose transferase-like glycosyltransferase